MGIEFSGSSITADTLVTSQERYLERKEGQRKRQHPKTEEIEHGEDDVRHKEEPKRKRNRRFQQRSSPVVHEGRSERFSAERRPTSRSGRWCFLGSLLEKVVLFAGVHHYESRRDRDSPARVKDEIARQLIEQGKTIK
jgi:hypothetical protein